MKSLIISLKLFILLSLLTGIVYPLVVTGLAQLMFPYKAGGSLIITGNRIIGSELIGQQSDSLVYFSSRPSSISYNPLPSGAFNYGLTNHKLKDSVDSRRQQFIRHNQLDTLTNIPSEMLFASASGLDPHISVRAAMLQVDRIAVARNFNDEQKNDLRDLIARHTDKKGILVPGKERINVLFLNLDVDKIK